MQSSDSDVVIIGAGIVGLSCALALSGLGFYVVILEGASQPLAKEKDARAYALNEASIQLLQSLGIWHTLDAKAQGAYQTMSVWDTTGFGSIVFDARMAGRPHLGVIVEDSALKQALLLKVQTDEKITIMYDCPVDKLHSNAKSADVLVNDKSYQAKLCVIADGPHSKIRNQLQIPISERPYYQSAIVARIKTANPHQYTARQAFLGDSILAFLPLGDLHTHSIVWSVSSDKAKKLMELEDDAFLSELRLISDPSLGDLGLESARYSYPLTMRHVKQYVGNRWLLMGDCAHTIHPLAGLGLNIGLADVMDLVSILRQRNIEHGLGKTLAMYQRSRKSDVSQYILAMDVFKSLFMHPAKSTVAIRNWGLNLCNQSQWLKRWFIEQANTHNF